MNKVDRPGRPDRGGRRRGLRALPRPRRPRVRRSSSRSSTRTPAPAAPRSTEDDEGTDLEPLIDLIVERIPAPEYEQGHPLQAHVTNLDASPYVGRLALAASATGRSAPASRSPGVAPTARSSAPTVSELYVTEALDRVEAERPGRARSSPSPASPDVTIGETLADPEDPRPLPVITVDEPSLSIIVGINTSPLAGQRRLKLTARQIRARLDQELVGNVSIRVARHRAPRRLGGPGPRRAPARRPAGDDAPRGLRADRRPAAGPRPARSTASVHEPVERLAIDVPEDYVGVVTQLLALRKGRMEQMVNHGTGWVRLEYLVPARGLIGFRTEFLTETRGTGLLHHVFDRWEPWAGELRTRPDRLAGRRPPRAQRASFALFGLQERGTLFVGPGEEVYEGMMVGENARADDLDVNAIKEKHLTNIRAADRRPARPPGARAPAVARPGARVPARGRVRGGHPRGGPAAQGRARPGGAGEGGAPGAGGRA